MANVFISHRTVDAAESKRLADDLTALGHHVWLDADQVKVGDSIVKRINEGLEGATHLVLCLSASGVDAPWTAQEWMSTLARQLSGHNVTIIPARLTGGTLPAILADIKFADLTTDWNAGVAAIASGMR